MSGRYSSSSGSRADVLLIVRIGVAQRNAVRRADSIALADREVSQRVIAEPIRRIELEQRAAVVLDGGVVEIQIDRVLGRPAEDRIGNGSVLGAQRFVRVVVVARADRDLPAIRHVEADLAVESALREVFVQRR